MIISAIQETFLINLVLVTVWKKQNSVSEAINIHIGINIENADFEIILGKQTIQTEKNDSSQEGIDEGTRLRTNCGDVNGPFSRCVKFSNSKRPCVT